MISIQPESYRMLFLLDGLDMWGVGGQVCSVSRLRLRFKGFVFLFIPDNFGRLLKKQKRHSEEIKSKSLKCVHTSHPSPLRFQVLMFRSLVTVVYNMQSLTLLWRHQLECIQMFIVVQLLNILHIYYIPNLIRIPNGTADFHLQPLGICIVSEHHYVCMKHAEDPLGHLV